MPDGPEPRAAAGSSLKQRVITAVILAPIALGLIALLPPAGLWWLVAALIGTAAYEWLPLAGYRAPAARWASAAVMAAATGLPVYSIETFVTWFQSGLSPRRFDVF